MTTSDLAHPEEIEEVRCDLCGKYVRPSEASKDLFNQDVCRFCWDTMMRDREQ